MKACIAFGERAVSSRWLPWLIILIGVGLRLVQYLYNRSLTGDEAALALNIIDRSYSELLQPLDYQQAAPIGFLMLQHLVIDLLGTSEYALRLVPLLAGIGSLILIYYIARIILSRAGLLIALALFALYSDLVYYSAEAKQYSTDVLIALGLTGFGLYILQNRLTPVRALIYAGVGAVLIWFSHPVLFTLAGLGVTLLVTSWRANDRQWALTIILIGAVWLGSFALFYFTSLQAASRNDYLMDFWARGFMPLPPRSFNDVLWLPIRFIDTFRTAFLYPLPGIAAFAFLAGCFTLYLRSRVHLFVLLTPVLFTLLAACLHQYPFLGRMILFLAPALIIFMAEGTDQVRLALAHRLPTNLSPRTLSALGVVFIVLVFANPLMMTMPIIQGALAFGTSGGEEGRLVLEHMIRNRQSEDVIYFYRPFEEPLLYYRDRYGLTDTDYVVGGNHRENWMGYYADIDSLPRAPRVWLLFTHVYRGEGADERLLILNYLDLTGATRTEEFAADGAWAYLYDLSDARRLVTSS
jgi:hypothetical protein